MQEVSVVNNFWCTKPFGVFFFVVMSGPVKKGAGV